MANPTTNYGWPMPTSTDLVTDLPADFAAFGQPVDTTLKALNPETTLGDISYRSATSNTNTRLGIGTNGQVLAVSGGVPAWTTTSDVTPLTTKGDLFTFDTADARLGVGTNGQTLVADSSTATGLKWATPAGGLTLIARTSFSAVASQAFDSVFTSTYKSYLVVIENLSAATSSDKLHLQFRYSSTTQATNYYGNNIWAGSSSATVANDFSNNVTFQIIAPACGSSSLPGSGYMVVSNVGTGSQTANANGMYVSNQQGNGGSFNCASTTARAYDGFLLKSASTNISGTVAIYGMAAA